MCVTVIWNNYILAIYYSLIDILQS